MPPDVPPDVPPEDDDATRIYRPFGSPPPDPPMPDPTAGPAPDPWAPAANPSPGSPVWPPAPTPSPSPRSPAPAPAPTEPDVFSHDPFRPAPPPPDPFAPTAVPDPFPAAPVPYPPPDPLPASPPLAAVPPPVVSVPIAPASPPPADSDPFRAAYPPPAAPPAAPLPAAPTPADDPWAPPPAPQPATPPPPRDPFLAPPPAGSAPPASDPFDSRVRPAAPDPFLAARATPAVPAGERLIVEQGPLAGAFASVFALILHLRTTSDFGDPAALRRRADTLIDQAVGAARASGADASDVRDAEFAVVAFFDETMLTSEWAGREAWAAQPLQLARYNRYDAGEAFFERLRTLLAERGREQVLEVFYLCLALGYKGRYQIHGREVLRQLVEDLHQRLSRTPEGAVGALAPHALPRGPAAVAARSGLPTWVLFVGAAILVALLYLGLSLSVSGIARDVATDIDARPATAAPSR